VQLAGQARHAMRGHAARHDGANLHALQHNRTSRAVQSDGSERGVWAEEPNPHLPASLASQPASQPATRPDSNGNLMQSRSSKATTAHCHPLHSNHHAQAQQPAGDAVDISHPASQPPTHPLPPTHPPGRW
jgi:hypothetical protein